MRITCILVGILICYQCVSQANAGCLCGAIGEDYCSSCKSYRPVPKFIGKPDFPAPPLPPVGDRCSCGKQLVEPAIPPKTCCFDNDYAIYHPTPFPLCSSCAPAGKPSCNACKALAGIKLESPEPCPCQVGPWIYANAIPKKCSGIPADPVSVSLAQRTENARSFSVPEEKIQYGHRTTPLCPIRRIYFSNVPEEKLWSINRQIIELKKKGFTKKYNEEIIEEEDSEEENPGPMPNYLTYGELGYCPEKFTDAKFIPAPEISIPPVPECMKPPPPIGDCGYKPGAIVPFNMVDTAYDCNIDERMELI